MDREATMSAPLVSVCMITYNHEPYLREAIESVLAQQASFDFELVIGEDCSPDRTREIALEFQQAHPDVVRVLPNTARLGAMKNFERTLAACRGQYLAFLEGDDFWTSPQKLQRQVNVLEAHSDISVVFHPVHMVPEAAQGEVQLFPRRETPQRTSIRDLLSGIYAHTASIMVRNPHLARLPAWLHESYMADWPFLILCARKGDIYCIPEPMATYRQTGGGIWSSLSHMEQTKHVMDACLTIDCGLSHEYSEILIPRARGFCYELAITYQKAGLLEEAKAHLKLYWRLAPLLSDWKAKLRLLLGIQYPRAWRAVQHLRGRTA
jgi:glycosyltransferase involved in cell wall biosynthesis